VVELWLGVGVGWLVGLVFVGWGLEGSLGGGWMHSATFFFIFC
jgi:hypothetical protein